MIEMLVSIILAILVVIQTTRLEKYREYSEKTIHLLQLCVDESTEANKALNDLLLSKLPHLKAQVDAEMEKWRESRELEG